MTLPEGPEFSGLQEPGTQVPGEKGSIPQPKRKSRSRPAAAQKAQSGHCPGCG